jgi:hypothetical protein
MQYFFRVNIFFACQPKRGLADGQGQFFGDKQISRKAAKAGQPNKDIEGWQKSFVRLA